MPARGRSYVLVALLFVIAYLYSIKFAPQLVDAQSGWRKRLNDLHESCVVKGRKLLPRGNSYYINSTNAAKQDSLTDCMVTFWGFTHFLLYFVIGFFFPSLFWETFLLGVAFELYEAKRFDCHDVFDIVLNTAGFVAGKGLATLLRRHHQGQRGGTSLE